MLSIGIFRCSYRQSKADTCGGFNPARFLRLEVVAGLLDGAALRLSWAMLVGFMAATAGWTEVCSAQTTPQDGQLTPETAAAPRPVPKEEPQEGLWPSEKLVELALSRWADELSRTYELDDAQRTNVREATVKRWGRFLKENRSELQPLFNEFLEMRMELEPPPKERVQAWAERALPTFDKAREELDKGTAEFREVLSPAQQSKFDLEAMQFGVGLQLAEHKLRQWKKGEFEVHEFWEPTGDRARRRRERRAAQEISKKESGTGAAEARPGESDQIALELESWDRYVEEFTRLYRLDDGQRTAVLSVLSEVKLRAITHRDRHQEEIVELERQIAGFRGADQELAELKKKLTELYGPVDTMFNELKLRIEQIPTTEQRAAAMMEREEGVKPAGGRSPGGTNNGTPHANE